ncbi:MAG: succinate dehydrogenase assembly factor 2 [Candidatus Thiodiazotropha sp.]
MGKQEVSRLRWRCRRGMLELDLLLLGFLEHGYQQLDPVQQQCFERLLQLPDQTLYEQLMGDAEPGEKEFADVIKWIRSTAAH